MTKSTDDKSAEVELEDRPARLGLGAVVPQQSSKVGPLNGRVERKLHAKLDSGKRKATKNTKESKPSVRDGDDAKRRVVPLPSSLQPKKKQK
ncbi:hypothetical protein CsSME_00012821 [Camellia sinensis var. sinensis]